MANCPIPGCPMVYFFQNRQTKEIKIGYSDDVEQRIKTLQTGSNARLVLLGTTLGDLEMERNLHLVFAEHRTWGEWFSPDPEMLNEIEYLCSPDSWSGDGYEGVPFPWVLPEL
jgi:hypothetical protein